ncbi:MAG: glycogen debranching N-terminal domain-containing protein [Thermoleophilia bacterium]
MTASKEQGEIVVGDESFTPVDRDLPVAATAERYVMGERRQRRLVIMENELFLYTDAVGDIARADHTSLGLYFQDTRFLSRLELAIGGRPPVLLSSSAELDYAESMELTNLEARTVAGRKLAQATIHVRRQRLASDRISELLRVSNYGSEPVELFVDLTFDADFLDLFEIRGYRRPRRGTLLASKVAERSLTLAYLGLDEVLRKTVITFEQAPESVQNGRARFRLNLAPREHTMLRFDIQVVVPGAPEPVAEDYTVCQGRLRREYERSATAADIFSDNEQFTALLHRSQHDLRMLTASTPYGSLPLAGVPWFAAPFGRDALITGLETLMFDARPAIETIRALTRLQGKTDSVWREEEPGKIMHELRRGELANLKIIPHTPYYGAADTTPLYLLLLSEVVMWTGDLEFFELLHEPILAALRWIDEFGDRDGDGFVEYQRRSRAGLANQGWRDASDAVLHANGTPAEGPIALADVQAYVYHAKRRLAALFGQLGDIEVAERLQGEAQQLKQRFNERFWMEDEQYIAMALDGEKRQVKTITSSAGHCLFARIVADEFVPAVVKRLLAPDMFTGWGVRTMSTEAIGFNPVSFYNGSVWPFDNAIIVRGLKKLGYAQQANRIAGGMIEAAFSHENFRLPELFCGFTRQEMDKPVSFPMACSPYASSAGAVFLMLQSLLGLYAAAEENALYVHNPVLPKWLPEVNLTNLHVGRSTMNLRFRREGGQTTFSVRDKQGGARIVVVE